MLTASYGGTHDELLAVNQLRFAQVVFSQTEADSLLNGELADRNNRVLAALVAHASRLAA